ncbi:MAG: polysaccharide deacetylase family protein [Verrucomicrobiota bacterium]
MRVFRLLIFCFFGFVAATQLRPETTAVPEQSPPKTESSPPPGPRITFNWIHVDAPYIAMTFDDGPSPTLTPKLLDLLAARQIKATFFVIGQNVAEYPELVARALREGHEIGNHSWSHPNLARMSDEAVKSQLKRTDDAIQHAAGVHPLLLRPPYGSITARQTRWIHDQFGYEIIMWDVDPLDWKRPGPTVVFSRILRETRPGSIVLSHDIHPGTIEAMPATLDQLAAKGFKFVTVSELIKLATPEPPKPKPAVRANNSPPASPAPAIRSTPVPREVPADQ